MTSDQSGPPEGGDDGEREVPADGGKADVVPLDALRRRPRKGEPETDPDPGDDPGPAAA